MNWKVGLALTLLLSSVSGSAINVEPNGSEDTEDDLDEEGQPWQPRIFQGQDAWLGEEYSPEDLLEAEALEEALARDGDELAGLNEAADDGEALGKIITSPVQKRSQLTWYPSRSPLDRLQSFFQQRVSRSGGRFFPNEYVKRRLCIPPTMSCNLRPNSCCKNTTCRCNLWGQNCRCLRMGFFQRWGKKK